MKKHVTIVGAIQIGFGTLGLIAAFVVYFALSFAKGFIQDQEIPSMIIGFLRVSLPILIAMLSILGLVGGIGLLSFKPWARILVIVVAALGCLNIPIGTLVGVYSIWVLMQDDTIKMFKETIV